MIRAARIMLVGAGLLCLASTTRAGTGTYFARLRVDGVALESRKLVLVK